MMAAVKKVEPQIPSSIKFKGSKKFTITEKIVVLKEIKEAIAKGIKGEKAIEKFYLQPALKLLREDF